MVILPNKDLLTVGAIPSYIDPTKKYLFIPLDRQVTENLDEVLVVGYVTQFYPVCFSGKEITGVYSHAAHWFEYEEVTLIEVTQEQWEFFVEQIK